MLITNKDELIRQIDGLLANKEIVSIDFICPHFKKMYKNIIIKNNTSNNLSKTFFEELMQIFDNTLQKNKNIQVNIHTFNEISEDMRLNDLKECKEVMYLQSFTKEMSIKQQEHKKLPIQIHNYNYHKNPLIDIIEILKQYTPKGKNINTLGELLDNLDNSKIEIDDFKNCKNSIHSLIDDINESTFFDNIIKSNLKHNFDEFLDDLLEQLKVLIQTGKNDNIKMYVRLIIGVLGSLSTVIVNPFISMVGISVSIVNFLMDYNELSHRKYVQLLSPLARFLATECGMFISYINTHLFTYSLIINNKSVIDFSAFGLNAIYHTNNITSQLAYQYSLQDNIEINFDSFFKQYADNTNSKNVFEIKNNNFISNMYLCNAEKENILESLTKSVEKFNHLSYIESPYFNSSKLAELFINKNNYGDTKMNKNYLIIANAPKKYNAKLTETITQSIIQNSIQDEYRKQAGFSYDAKKKTYNSTRDYSDYMIQIDTKDDKPYILQLSPFVKISYSNYKEYEKAHNAFNDAIKNINTLDSYSEDAYELKQSYEEIKKRNEDKHNRYVYISNFFKQDSDKQNIIQKEEELTKEYLSLLENYCLNNIDLSKAPSDLNSNIEYLTNEFRNLITNKPLKTSYSLLQCFIIIYALYYTHKLFPSINLAKTIDDNSDSRLFFTIKYLNTLYYIYCPSFSIEGYNEKSHNLINNTLKTLLKEDNKKDDYDKFTQDIFEKITKEMKQYQSYEEKLESELNEFQDIMFKNEYINAKNNQKIQIILSQSILKVVASIFPLSNFVIEENPINNIEHVVKIFLRGLVNGKDEAFLQELGVFHLLKQQIAPDDTFVHISINDVNSQKEQLKAGKQAVILDLIHTKHQNAHFQAKVAIISNIKIKLSNSGTLTLDNVKKQAMRKFPNDEKLINAIYFTYNSSETHQSHLIGRIQCEKIIEEAKSLAKNKVKQSVRGNLIGALLDMAINVGLELLLPTNYEALEKQYQSIIYKLYTFKYDDPYAVIKENDVVTYPFIVNSKFISFDFKKLFYGIELCSGVFHNHLSFKYEINQKLQQTHDFLIKRLLSYIILDEKRSSFLKQECKEIDDETFFHSDLRGIEISRAQIYQLMDEEREREYKLANNDIDLSAIKAYNEVIGILADYANHYYTNSFNNGKWLPDKNKARRLLENLNIIGQNNIKALYVGIKEEQDNSTNATHHFGINPKNANTKEKRPKLIGRLATTIIIEDGLWIG